MSQRASEALDLDNTHQAVLGFGVLFAAILLLAMLFCYGRSHAKKADWRDSKKSEASLLSRSHTRSDALESPSKGSGDVEMAGGGAHEPPKPHPAPAGGEGCTRARRPQRTQAHPGRSQAGCTRGVLPARRWTCVHPTQHAATAAGAPHSSSAAAAAAAAAPANILRLRAFSPAMRACCSCVRERATRVDAAAQVGGQVQRRRGAQPPPAARRALACRATAHAPRPAHRSALLSGGRQQCVARMRAVVWEGL